MMLQRALSAEILKLKRSIAWKMVMLAPLAVVLLTLFMTASAPFSTLRQGGSTHHWNALAKLNLQFWGFLMMPLYITLQTAVLAGLDHTANQWKAVFARPIPRWTVYVAKLLIAAIMTVAASAILFGGILLTGPVLNHLIPPDFRFASPVPIRGIFTRVAQMTGLAFLALTIQHWVSLRWRPFSVAVGFGIVATITTVAMVLSAGPTGSWPEYYPWALPLLVLANHPHNISAVLWIGAVLGIIASLAGCVDFCRREVS